MRKQTMVTGVLLSSLVALSACGNTDNEGNGNNNAGGNNTGNDHNNGNNNEEAAQEDVTIEFWTMQLQPTFTEYIEGLIDAYEEEHSHVTINWVDVPASDLEQKILSDISAGNEPDVVNLNPSFGANLAELDALTILDDEISQEEQDVYLEGAWEANQLDGDTFAFPWYLGTEIAYSNTEVYEEAGLDPENPPANFEEAAEQAEIVMDETGKYGFFPSFEGTLPMQYLVKMGADLTNEERTEAAFNSPEGIAAVEYFAELYQEGLIPPESLGEQREITNMYTSGQLAFGENIFMTEVSENAPEVYEVSEPSEALTGESGKKNMNVQNLVIPEGSENKEESIQFAQFVTNPENQLEFTKLTAILPSTEETLEDPYFTDLPDDAEAADYERIISAQQLPDAELLVPPMNNFSELQSAIHDAFAKALLEEATPEEALAEAEEEWNELLVED
ncbi:ABC transporter substrate-binding protein [Salisediminibacterium beveridgei]|uniref:ABC transporter substrate-binding protein n=1 Tax=Salisediminibacterium beveridgei TaxID=632773 RepID=UPI000847E918|nr:sugar ABC transporter substrate-binding protein [Salisediminibacterium beveridgei]